MKKRVLTEIHNVTIYCLCIYIYLYSYIYVFCGHLNIVPFFLLDNVIYLVVLPNKKLEEWTTPVFC